MPRNGALALWVLVCVGVCWVGAGCVSKSTRTVKGLVSTTVYGASAVDVDSAIVDVFAANGWKMTYGGMGNFAFEKKGNTFANVMYGNWMGEGTEWDARVWVDPGPSGEWIVRCNPKIQRDPGGLGEAVYGVSTLQKGGFQRLMDDIKKRVEEEI